MAIELSLKLCPDVAIYHISAAIPAIIDMPLLIVTAISFELVLPMTARDIEKTRRAGRRRYY